MSEHHAVSMAPAALIAANRADLSVSRLDRSQDLSLLSTGVDLSQHDGANVLAA